MGFICSIVESGFSGSDGVFDTSELAGPEFDGADTITESSMVTEV
jgi:hypothetical protein